MMKRVTPEDDYNRLAERIWNRGRGKIASRDDYDTVFSGYLKGKDLSHAQQTRLRDGVFGKLQKRHKIDPYVRQGGRTIGDIERRDTFGQLASMPSKNEFSFCGYSGKRQVYLRRTILVFAKSGRRVTVYRDAKGRFGRIK